MKQKAGLNTTKVIIHFIEEFWVIEDTLKIYGTDVPYRTMLEMRIEELLFSIFKQAPELKDITGVKEIKNIEKVFEKVKGKQKTK